MRGTLVLLAITIMLVNSTAYAEAVERYYESGQLKFEEHFKDEKADGTFKEYYESGQLKEEAYFMNGVMISQKKYDQDGNLESDQGSPTE